MVKLAITVYEMDSIDIFSPTDFGVDPHTNLIRDNIEKA